LPYNWFGWLAFRAVMALSNGLMLNEIRGMVCIHSNCRRPCYSDWNM